MRHDEMQNVTWRTVMLRTDDWFWSRIHGKFIRLIRGIRRYIHLSIIKYRISYICIFMSIHTVEKILKILNNFLKIWKM